MAKVLLYRGIVTDLNDPDRKGRVAVEILALGVGEQSAWTKVFTVPVGQSWSTSPQVDDDVVICFELGNLTMPVVFPPTVGPMVPGLVLLPGVVVDTADPMGQGRVRVRLPALSDETTAWGTICTPLTPATMRTLAVDATVAVTVEGRHMVNPFILGLLP